MGAVTRTCFLALVVIACALSAGCKEGDSLLGGITPAIADFVAEPRPPDLTERYVFFRTSLLDGGRIILDIVVTEVDEEVIGIAMKLSYDSTYAKFIDCTDGDLLASGSCLSAEPTADEVFISRSITDPGDATTIDGEQLIARLEFLVFGDGAEPIVIEGQNLGGGDASALLDTGGDPILVQWFSGVLLGESVVGP